jgi:hypothetical protein
MNLNPPILSKSKWPVKLIIVFVVCMILGFTPWESMLSIQIRGVALNWLTSASMGLGGSFGLAYTVLIYAKRNYKRFSILVMILLPCLLIPISLILIISLVLPTFQWQDTDVYQNGDDYLVMQVFEGFVTSSLRNPRVVRTPSPYGLIRKVEEMRWFMKAKHGLNK